MKRRSFFVITVILMVSLLTTTTVFAVSSRSSFTWLQSVAPSYYSGEFHQDGSSSITFEGVATSPSSGTFKAILQRHEWYGWVDAGYKYTVNQNSNQTYNSTTGGYVIGQFFRLYWPTSGNYNYRVVLSQPSNSQATVFTQVRY